MLGLVEAALVVVQQSLEKAATRNKELIYADKCATLAV